MVKKMNNQPELVILVGLPGSGKSTMAHEQYPKYEYINQDTLGSREVVNMFFNRAINEKMNIVLDRCNINKSQRRPFIRAAKNAGYKVRCNILTVSKDICIERVINRKDHQTIKNLTVEKVKDIVYNFAKSYEEPSNEEGIDTLVFYYL